MLEEKSELPGIFAGKFMQNEHCVFFIPCVGGFHTNNCCFAQRYIMDFLEYYLTLLHLL